MSEPSPRDMAPRKKSQLEGASGIIMLPHTFPLARVVIRCLLCVFCTPIGTWCAFAPGPRAEESGSSPIFTAFMAASPSTERGS